MAGTNTTVTAVGNYQPAQAANPNEQEKAKVWAEIKKLENEYTTERKCDEAKLNKINQLKDKYRELCSVKITPENPYERKSDNDLFGINQIPIPNNKIPNIIKPSWGSGYGYGSAGQNGDLADYVRGGGF